MLDTIMRDHGGFQTFWNCHFLHKKLLPSIKCYLFVAVISVLLKICFNAVKEISESLS